MILVQRPPWRPNRSNEGSRGCTNQEPCPSQPPRLLHASAHQERWRVETRSQRPPRTIGLQSPKPRPPSAPALLDPPVRCKPSPWSPLLLSTPHHRRHTISCGRSSVSGRLQVGLHTTATHLRPPPNVEHRQPQKRPDRCCGLSSGNPSCPALQSESKLRDGDRQCYRHTVNLCHVRPDWERKRHLANKNLETMTNLSHNGLSHNWEAPRNPSTP